MTATPAAVLTARVRTSIPPAVLGLALEVAGPLLDRRRPLHYFTGSEQTALPYLEAAGIVRRFRDGHVTWLEIVDEDDAYDEDDDACDGHEATTAGRYNGPIGETVYCPGRCTATRRR